MRAEPTPAEGRGERYPSSPSTSCTGTAATNIRAGNSTTPIPSTGVSPTNTDSDFNGLDIGYALT